MKIFEDECGYFVNSIHRMLNKEKITLYLNKETKMETKMIVRKFKYNNSPNLLTFFAFLDMLIDFNC